MKWRGGYIALLLKFIDYHHISPYPSLLPCQTSVSTKRISCPTFIHECIIGFEPHVRHQNKIQKTIFWRFPLSRFLAKTLRANKIVRKSFSKSLSIGVDFKLYDFKLYLHLWIKLAHRTAVVWETRSIILTIGLKWPIMYVYV